MIREFEKEDDEGNIEYKLKLVQPTEDRVKHLATQMKFRVNEGNGECYYRIGVEDSGKPTGLGKEEMFESLKTICYIAQKIYAYEVMVLKVSQGIRGLIIELMIRKRHRLGIKLEVRVLLFGDPGSGKSTLLGCLKSGEQDDGKGLTRMKVFSNKQEIMTGITQTTSHHLVGFDATGKIYKQNEVLSLERWFDNVNKLLSFIDVGGHKKAEKQLISSLCSYFPEYALWIVSAKTSFDPTASCNSLQLARIFNLPLIVVITH